MTLPPDLRRVFDPERVDAVRRFRVMGSEPEPAFDRIVEAAAKACETPMAFLTFLDDRRQWIKASYGGSTGETTLDRAICAAALEEDGLFVVPDCSADPRVNWCAAVYGDPPVAFYAGSLLLDAAGQRLGTLCVVDVVPRPGGLTMVERLSLKALSSRAMAVLEGKPG